MKVTQTPAKFKVWKNNSSTPLEKFPIFRCHWEVYGIWKLARTIFKRNIQEILFFNVFQQPQKQVFFWHPGLHHLRCWFFCWCNMCSLAMIFCSERSWIFDHIIWPAPSSGPPQWGSQRDQLVDRLGWAAGFFGESFGPKTTRWWQLKYILFSTLFGEMIQFD